AYSLVAPAEQKLLNDVQRLTGIKLKMEQLNIRDVEMPDKDAVAIEPPEDERRRAGREGGGPRGQNRRGAQGSGERRTENRRARPESKPRQEFKKPARPSKPNRRDDAEARPPKRDPDAPVWNPIRARVDAESDDRERFAREETVRPKKKGSPKKRPKPGNHRKGQPRAASAAEGKNKGQRQNAAPANNPRSDRGSPSKAKRPSEAAA
ncbi:MAG: hypothetical protein P8R39_04110, partial [Alphaproteobacteria bacterium]|nr:hypothetical protein [Alphaproteobacteria bacterium]